MSKKSFITTMYNILPTLGLRINNEVANYLQAI